MSLTVRDVQRARAGCNSRTQQCGRIDDPPARWRRHRATRRARALSARRRSRRPDGRVPARAPRRHAVRQSELSLVQRALSRVRLHRPHRHRAAVPPRSASAACSMRTCTSYAEVRVPVLTCEVFLEPRDDISVLFHGTYGFQEVGQQTMAGVGPPRRAAGEGSVQLSVRARHAICSTTACRT